MKLSPQQAAMLRRLAAGGGSRDHCRTMGDHGGAGATESSLRRRGLMTDGGDITDAGREAIAEHEGRS